MLLEGVPLGSATGWVRVFRKQFHREQRAPCCGTNLITAETGETVSRVAGKNFIWTAETERASTASSRRWPTEGLEAVDGCVIGPQGWVGRKDSGLRGRWRRYERGGEEGAGYNEVTTSWRLTMQVQYVGVDVCLRLRFSPVLLAFTAHSAWNWTLNTDRPT